MNFPILLSIIFTIALIFIPLLSNPNIAGGKRNMLKVVIPIGVMLIIINYKESAKTESKQNAIYGNSQAIKIDIEQIKKLNSEVESSLKRINSINDEILCIGESSQNLMSNIEDAQTKISLVTRDTKVLADEIKNFSKGSTEPFLVYFIYDNVYKNLRLFANQTELPVFDVEFHVAVLEIKAKDYVESSRDENRKKSDYKFTYFEKSVLHPNTSNPIGAISNKLEKNWFHIWITIKTRTRIFHQQTFLLKDTWNGIDYLQRSRLYNQEKNELLLHLNAGISKEKITEMEGEVYWHIYSNTYYLESKEQLNMYNRKRRIKGLPEVDWFSVYD